MTTPRTPSGQTRRAGRARQRVLDAVVQAGRAVSAEDVAALVPDVHVSSVYRALAVLEEEGVVAHVHLGHAPAVYQLLDDQDRTGHLVCEVCGHHEPVPEASLRVFADDLRGTYGFEVDLHHFALVGRCRECAQSGASTTP